MAITRSTYGKLWNDTFDTDTRSSYTLTGTTGYDSVDKRLQLAQNTGTTGTAEIPSASLSAHDMVVTGKFVFPNYTTSSTQFLTVYSRYVASPLFNITAVMYDGSGSPTDTIYLRMYKDGANSDLTSFPYTINRNTEYRFKLSTVGTAVRFKIWPATDSEPQSWNATYDLAGDYGGSGTSRAYAYLIPTEYDEWRIYKKNTVTCSGLPTGYKFRIGGTGGAVATEAGGTATVDCSHLSFPVSLVEVLNPSDSVVDSLTLTNDVWGGDGYSFTGVSTIQSSFTADAALKKTLPFSHTADSVLKKSNISGSFSADATFKKPNIPSSFHSNAVVKKTGISGGCTANTVLKKPGIQGSLTANAVTLKQFSSSFTTNASIILSPNATFSGNAVLKKTVSVTYTAESVFKKNITVGFSADADLKTFVTREYSFAADSVLTRYAVAIRATADAVIKKTPTQAISADARLLKITTGTFIADARLMKLTTGTITASSVLAKYSVNLSFTGSAALTKKSITGSFTAQAVIRRELSAAFNPRAVLRKNSVTGSSTVNSVFLKTIQGSFMVNAGLPARYSANITADGYLVKTVVVSLISNSVLFKVIKPSFTADAYTWDLDRYLYDITLKVEKSFTINTTATKQASYTLNLVKQATYDVNVGFS